MIQSSRHGAATVPSRPGIDVRHDRHPRAGAFGVIHGSTNGADFLSVGARYRF